MTIETYLKNNPQQRRYADLLVMPPTADEIRAEFPDADKDLIERCDGAISDEGFLLSRGAFYVILRRQGECDRVAAMLALQRPARGQTNDTFWGGRKHFSEVYGEEYANQIRKGLARQGINLKAGDEYMPELARFRCDPEAVVPFGGGRSYIKSICEKRGWACEGAENVEHREPDEDPWATHTPLGEDIIRTNIQRMVKKDPSLKRKSRSELREAVLAKHGPSK